MDKQIWGKYMQQAAVPGDHDMGVGFADGTLDGPKDAATADVKGLQWVHTPAKDTAHPVTISIYKTSSDQKATDLYKSMKTADWKEWPSSYPNRNDYEDVDHCGIKTTGSHGLAVWTHDPDRKRGSYLVVMSGGTGGTEAFEAGLDEGHTYADGIYLVVYKSTKEENDAKKKVAA